MRESARVKAMLVLGTVALWGAAASPPDSLVADAAMRGDVEAVRALLRDGADVNAAQGDGMTALHWAAQNGDGELAEVLIYAGANLEAVTRVGAYTPLHLASKTGHVTVVRRLLGAGADPNTPTATGVIPLHFAAGAGSPETIRVLVDHGADANAREGAYGQTPLMFAASYGRVEAVEALLSRGAQPGITTEVIDVPALAEQDRTEREQRTKRLAILAETAAEEAEQPAETDEEEPQEENEQEDEPAEEEQPQAEEAEDRQASEEEEEPKRLSYAELVGKQGGLTALHHAARQGNTESALALLEGGADINQVTGGDHTSPLLIATINGHFDMAMELLERGADPNLASDAGATPLYGAINLQWIPKSFYPHPTDHKQQQTKIGRAHV